MKIIGTYVLTDLNTGNFYIGSSGNVKKRIGQHISNLKNQRHHNVILQSLWNNCCNLLETIFPTETREEAYILEQDMLDRFRNDKKCINIGLVAFGGDNLTRHPDRENIIKKITESLRKHLLALTPLEKKLLHSQPGSKNGMWGRSHSVEAMLKISKAQIGNSSSLGRKLTPEQCKKISEHAKLRIGDKNSFFNKHHSEKTKKLLSDKMKARGHIPENARRVEINGISHESVTGASRAIGVSPALIIYRINSEKERYSSYCYIA